MEKFLIINPFGIGDVLFTTPVIRALKKNYPDSFIGYWCNERVGGLLRSNPDINKVFPLSRGDIKRVYKGLEGFAVILSLIRQIRKEKFDAAFDFSLDSRYGFWSGLAGIKKRIGFNYKRRGRFLTDKVELQGYSGKHVIDYYLDLLKFVEIETSSPGLDAANKGRTGRGWISYYLDVSKENSAKAKATLAGYGIKPSDITIGVAMGGGESWGPDALYKQWPAKKFAQLADRLIRDYNAYIILLGSPNEKPLSDIILNDVKSKNMTDLTGRLSLEELAAMIKELKALVCNDGGPLHMAAALGTSTVSIFGPVDERVYGPYPPGERHIVIKKDLSCRPCYQNFRFKGCSNNRRCLEDIDVDEVYGKVKTLL